MTSTWKLHQHPSAYAKQYQTTQHVCASGPAKTKRHSLPISCIRQLQIRYHLSMQISLWHYIVYSVATLVVALFCYSWYIICQFKIVCDTILYLAQPFYQLHQFVVDQILPTNINYKIALYYHKKLRLTIKGVSLRDFLDVIKEQQKFCYSFRFCSAKHTTLLAKYSVLHF